MDDLAIVMNDVENEVKRAIKLYPEPFNSPHEGYAVALEEMDEVWQEVKKKPAKRDPVKLYCEAVQTAAMMVRFAMECCNAPDSD